MQMKNERNVGSGIAKAVTLRLFFIAGAYLLALKCSKCSKCTVRRRLNMFIIGERVARPGVQPYFFRVLVHTGWSSHRSAGTLKRCPKVSRFVMGKSLWYDWGGGCTVAPIVPERFSPFQTADFWATFECDSRGGATSPCAPILELGHLGAHR